jgi:glutamine synthetase
MSGTASPTRSTRPRKGFGPFDVNIYQLPAEEQAKIGSLPTSFEEALEPLKNDNKFLLQGGVGGFYRRSHQQLELNFKYTQGSHSG